MLSVPFTFSSVWGNLYYTQTFICLIVSVPGVSVVKHSLANAGDAGLIPESGRSLGVGNGNLSQYSCQENYGQRSWWVQSMRSQRAGRDRAAEHTRG